MKIFPVHINHSKTQNAAYPFVQKSKNDKEQLKDLGKMPYYVSFQRRESFDFNDFQKAQSYLNTAKESLSPEEKRDLSIYFFDLDKLNGIQKGIRVFDGMNMKEIAFIMNNLTEIAVFRGCYNNCAHCYADAKPPIKESPTQTAKMEWEDFELLCNGIKELNKRLGFSINHQFNNKNQYMTAFHDADCSQIYLKDKSGKTHDWSEIAQKLYEATEVKQIFDTAGWYLEDKEAQKRVEKYVKDVVKNGNKDYLWEFNVSVNPYHAMHYRAVEHMKSGNKAKEEFFREKDAQRMANALFTLTPLLKEKNKIQFIARAMNNDSFNSEGLSKKDLIKTYKRYRAKLSELYESDLNKEQKIIKNRNQIQQYLKAYDKLLDIMTETPSVTKKLKDIYEPNDPAFEYTRERIFDNPKEAIEEYDFGTIIDANGDIYMTNFYETYKVDLNLNFANSNRNKKTQNLSPNLSQKRVSRALINKHISNINNS